MPNLTDPTSLLIILGIGVGALLIIGLIIAGVSALRAKRRSRKSMPNSATDWSKFGADMRRRNENGRN